MKYIIKFNSTCFFYVFRMWLLENVTLSICGLHDISVGCCFPRGWDTSILSYLRGIPSTLRVKQSFQALQNWGNGSLVLIALWLKVRYSQGSFTLSNPTGSPSRDWAQGSFPKVTKTWCLSSCCREPQVSTLAPWLDDQPLWEWWGNVASLHLLHLPSSAWSLGLDHWGLVSFPPNPSRISLGAPLSWDHPNPCSIFYLETKAYSFPPGKETQRSRLLSEHGGDGNIFPYFYISGWTRRINISINNPSTNPFAQQVYLLLYFKSLFLELFSFIQQM